MKIQFNWGTGIALTYGAFALATSAFVVFAMERHVDLVSPDYYAQSLQVDRRMAAEANARALGSRLSVEHLDGRALRVSLPSDVAPVQGTMTLYRASDARADRTFALALDRDGRQDVSLDGLAAGHWLVKLQWTAGGREYYAERAVIVR